MGIFFLNYGIVIQETIVSILNNIYKVIELIHLLIWDCCLKCNKLL